MGSGSPHTETRVHQLKLHAVAGAGHVWPTSRVWVLLHRGVNLFGTTTNIMFFYATVWHPRKQFIGRVRKVSSRLNVRIGRFSPFYPFSVGKHRIDVNLPVRTSPMRTSPLVPPQSQLELTGGRAAD